VPVPVEEGLAVLGALGVREALAPSDSGAVAVEVGVAVALAVGEAAGSVRDGVGELDGVGVGEPEGVLVEVTVVVGEGEAVTVGVAEVVMLGVLVPDCEGVQELVAELASPGTHEVDPKAVGEGAEEADEVAPAGEEGRLVVIKRMQ
jgi:hypothetical protein